MRIVVVSAILFCLLGCAATPGFVPGIGGRTIIEREFADSDSHYTESIKAPAGVDASKLSKFSLELEDGAGLKYKVGLDSSDDVSTQGQAELLGQISRDSVEALAAALNLLEKIVPSLLPLLEGLAASDGGNDNGGIVSPELLEALRAISNR